MNSVIYKIESIINNNYYIGSAIYFNKRKGQHLYELKNNKHCNKILQNHVNKYGINDLVFSIIEIVENINDLINREQYYLNLLKPHFNICKIAGSRLGTKHSKESIEKQSIAHKNISEETREKMRESSKKRVITEETRKKLIEIAKKRKGVKRSIEICEKIKNTKRETAKYRIYKPLTQEHKDNISKANINRKLTEETKLKISKAKKGVKLSEKAKQNMRKPKNKKQAMEASHSYNHISLKNNNLIL